MLLLGIAEDQGGIRSQEPDSIMKLFLRKKQTRKKDIKVKSFSSKWFKTILQAQGGNGMGESADQNRDFIGEDS